MAFNVSGLQDYVNENRTDLLARAVVLGSTVGLVQKIPNVKGPTTVNKIGTNVFFQDGSSCGNTVSGDVTFTQRTLTPGKLRLVQEFCPKDLESKYLSLKLSAGSTYTTLPFEEVIMSLFVNEIQAELERMVWRSNASTGTGNFQFFDGFITNIETGANFIDANVAGAFATPLGAFTQATMIEAIQRLAYYTPEGIQESSNTKIFMGIDKFNLLNANLLNGGTTFGQLANMNMASSTKRMFWPGTNMEIIGVAGLSGQNRIYAANLDNMFIGVDVEDEESALKVWYSDDDDKIRLRSTFTIGTQVAYQQEIAAIII
jgi:hypothetical protein